MQNDNAAKFPFTVTANICFARPEALAGAGSYQKTGGSGYLRTGAIELADVIKEPRV